MTSLASGRVAGLHLAARHGILHDASHYPTSMRRPHGRTTRMDEVAFDARCDCWVAESQILPRTEHLDIRAVKKKKSTSDVQARESNFTGNRCWF